MLIAIALLFSIAWLPLNVLNLVLDLYNPFSFPGDEEKMLIIYAVCHLFGMSSACANPFLYGWFNGNFRNEFIRIFGAPLRLCFSSSGRAGRSLSTAANRSSITVNSHPEIGRNNTTNVDAVLDEQEQPEMENNSINGHGQQAEIGGEDVDSFSSKDEITKITLSGSLVNKKTKEIMETHL